MSTHTQHRPAFTGETKGGKGAALRGVIGGALGYFARSALELHRYRYVRTRMLHDSLRKLDCQDCRK
jgi:hypothetical protein